MPAGLRNSGLQGALYARAAFGIGLGLFELLRPEPVVRADGLNPGSEGLVRVSGLHKLIIGGGLMLAEDKTLWLAAALAGSAFDGACLATDHARPVGYARLAALATVDALLLAGALREDW